MTHSMKVFHKILLSKDHSLSDVSKKFWMILLVLLPGQICGNDKSLLPKSKILKSVFAAHSSYQ